MKTARRGFLAALAVLPAVARAFAATGTSHHPTAGAIRWRRFDLRAMNPGTRNRSDFEACLTRMQEDIFARRAGPFDRTYHQFLKGEDDD